MWLSGYACTRTGQIKHNLLISFYNLVHFINLMNLLNTSTDIFQGSSHEETSVPQVTVIGPSRADGSLPAF